MQSVLFSAIIVLCFVSTTLAALALGPAQVDSSHPNECYIESTKEFYKPGESWTESGCQEASCIQVNYTGVPRLMISYATCGVVAVDPPCYLTENHALNYPDCCPEPTCPEESQEETKEQGQHKEPEKPQKDQVTESADSKENYHHDSENELINDHHVVMDEFLRQNSFRNYPWDDYYLYGDQDHVDNNVDDLQYLDYYPNERSNPRLSRHDFNIDNFKWF